MKQSAAARLASLDAIIARLRAARRPNAAYLAARVAERERLRAEIAEAAALNGGRQAFAAQLERGEQEQRAEADRMGAPLNGGGRCEVAIPEAHTAPDPDPVRADAAPERQPWNPTPEEILDDGEDPGAALDRLLKFLRKDGSRMLERKARRGDLGAMRELKSIAKMLMEYDTARAANCPAECCAKARQRRPVNIKVYETGTAEADTALARAEGDPSVRIYRRGWCSEGAKG